MVASLSTLHPDIIRTHILTRLDGPALMATSTASTRLRDLSSEENLWQQICLATWDSTSHPRVRQVISTFPNGHRSFFSDSFPLFFGHSQPSNPDFDHDRSRRGSSLISAVDMHYKNDIIFSRVHETDTGTDKFFRSPFRVELLDPRETVQTPVHHNGNVDSWLKHMEENLSLSWIVIDPSGKRAANLSTRRPVRVEWPCTAGDVQLHYTTIVAGNGQIRGSRAESIECGLVVTCSGVEEEKLQVEEVSMYMKDMDGRNLNGGDSLDLLRRALKNGNRKKGKTDEGKQKYREFMKRKEEMREKEHRRERTLDQLHLALNGCIVFWICSVLAVWLMELLS